MIRLLQRLVLAAARRARTTFAVFALLLVASLALASRLSFDTDVLNLLPRKDPTVQTFRRFIEQFGSLDLMLVAVRLPAGEPVDPYEEFGERIGVELERLPQLEYVDYRVGDLDELLRTFLPRSLLFLDRPGLDAVAAKLQPAAIRARAGELRRQLTAPQSLAMKPFFLLDPLGLSEILMRRWGSAPGAMSVDLSSGYYLSRDHRMLLVLAKPRRAAQDIDFDRVLVAASQAAIERARADWPRLAAGGNLPPPEVLLGGGYVTALEDASLIRGDLILNILSSLLLVLLLFLWAFRRLGPLAFALLPLLVGITMTFGFAALALGSLSSATSGVAALLIGLGIDFVIIEYGRYIEERRLGRSVGQALRRVVAGPVPGIVYGAFTTAATFYSFLVTDFAGLEQLGLLAGTGILLCLGSVLLLMPALLAWSERRHRRRERQPRMTLHAFGAEHLAHWAYRAPGAAMMTALAITLLAGVAMARLRFNGDIAQMRSPNNRGIRVLEEVSRHFGSGFEYMAMVIHGRTPEEVLATSAKAAAGARELIQRGVLQHIDGVTVVLPPPERQHEAVNWLREHRASGLTDPARLGDELASALAEAGLRIDPFAEGIALVRQAFAVDQALTVADFDRTPQTKRLLERYLRRVGGEWQGVLKLFPPGRKWRAATMQPVEQLARSLGPRVELTGVSIVSQELRGRVLHEAVVAGVLGLLLVGVLLWFSFRSWRGVALSLAPLALGIIWMLGGMSLCGIDMNQMNVFVTTMILGIGVDYGVHMLFRYNEFAPRSEAEVAAGLGETAKAVVLSAMTTVVGFGGMATSRYPGLRSVGYVATLGCVACALVAVTLVPAMLSWGRRRRRVAD